MAHKHQPYPHKHRHGHRDEKQNKGKSELQNKDKDKDKDKAKVQEGKGDEKAKDMVKDVVQDTTASENARQIPTWSEPIMDPSGQFVYQAILMPNGAYRYRIMGPETLKDYHEPCSAHIGAYADVGGQYISATPTTNPAAVEYEYEEGDFNDEELLPTPAQGRISDQPFADNNLSIMQPGASNDGTGQELVLAIRESPDADNVPGKQSSVKTKTKKSSSHRTHGGHSRGHKSRTKKAGTQPSGGREAHSKSKVSAWLETSEP